MRTNYRFKTALLLLMAVGGASSAWADGTISIPQELGSYILIGNGSTNPKTTATGVTLSNAQVDGSSESSYTIGSTGGSTTATLTVEATGETADYVFGFKTGANGCTAELSLSLKNSSSTEVWNNTASVVNTSNWDLVTNHQYKITNLAAGVYTMTISVSSNTGSYAGNWGNFYFHSLNQLAMPTTTSSYLELSDGVFSNARDNADNVVNYIYDGGYIDGLLINNTAEGYHSFNFNIDGFQNYDDSQVSITISDFETGTQEFSQTVNVTKSGNYVLPLSGNMTAGLKKVRIGFASAKALAASNHHLFNFRYVYFPSYTYDALPLTGTATLNLNQSTATWINCGYESGDSKDNLGNVIGASPSADNYYVNNTNEEAYYDVYANIPWYKSETQLKVTITDLATGTEEATGTSAAITSAAGDIHFALNNAITPGAKRIRFDFVSATTDAYLINVKNVSFYKRSLNEAYDYTPVEASGVDVVLTRSLTAGKWSTIVLPFDVASENIETIFGTGTTVAELTSSDATTLNFTTTLTDSKMKANQPYAIKVATDFTSATISNVNIVADTPTQIVGTWNFTGSYTNGTIPNGSYYFSANKLWQASGTGIRMKPFRAYFTNGTAAPTLNFIIDSETTGIGEKLNVNSNNAVSTTYYNLNGQRVSQPTKGLYIVNGKKVIIK